MLPSATNERPRLEDRGSGGLKVGRTVGDRLLRADSPLLGWEVTVILICSSTTAGPGRPNERPIRKFGNEDGSFGVARCREQIMNAREFTNIYADRDYVASYAAFDWGGTYHLIYRDLP